MSTFFSSSQNIDYFLFAPGLTMFSTPAADRETFIVINETIVYQNGAKVATGFVTNCSDRGMRIMVRGDLSDRIRALKIKAKLPKYRYPPEVVSAGTLRAIARNGVVFEIPADECHRITKIQTQGEAAIFGGGYLISERAAAERAAAERAAAERAAAERAAAERAAAERAAAERAAAERAAVFELSEREKAIVKRLSKK